MHKLNKSGAISFIEYLIAKGLVNTNTGNGWKAATNKVLEEFGLDDDLSDVDVPSEVLKYNNRHPGALSPDSLNQYQKRVVTVISEFKKYLASPTTYKGANTRPISAAVKVGVKLKGPLTEVKPAEQGTAIIETPPPAKHPTSAVTDTSLMMPFPLRPTFLAQLIIPRDLSKDEATRLCAFIQALAVDTPMVPA